MIIVLSIICGILLMAFCVAVWIIYKCLYYIQIMTAAEREAQYDEDEIAFIFPCTLFIDVVFEQDVEQEIFDLSKYEEFGIIGLQIFTQEKQPGDNIATGILQDAYVYITEGGRFRWCSE